MANGNGNGNGNGAAIIATVLIVTLVVAIAIVVILLVFASGNNQNGADINVGQITINECKTSGNIPRQPLNTTARPMRNENIQIVQNPTSNHIQVPDRPVIPTFKPMRENTGQPGQAGIMNNNPEAQEKKWDPAKNFPNRNPPVRPEGTLGAKFGPSETEMQMYLPTMEEIFASKGHVAGPKHIRRGPRYHRGNDFRPILIPTDYKDYDTVRRPNRPRIDESYFKEAIEMEERYYGKSIPKIIPPAAVKC